MADTNLFTEIALPDGLKLKNRMALAPLTRARAGASRIPTKTMEDYYTQRSSCGLVIAEATAISEEGYGWYGAPALYNQEQADGWKSVVDAVHSKGGIIFLQEWHMGRQSHPSFHASNEILFASNKKIETGHVRDANGEQQPLAQPRAMTEDEIKRTVQDYKKCAALAESAGFDGVEIHAANGYLIDGFLQTSTNDRTDNYGGSVENRFRFLKEIIESVLEVYPASRIGVRLSPNGAYGGMGSSTNYDDFPQFARMLQPYGLAYLVSLIRIDCKLLLNRIFHSTLWMAMALAFMVNLNQSQYSI